MPVTPFHFGPAAVAKGVSPEYFSFMAFGLTQVLIDAEPLVYMSLGAWPIHRFLHTYLGATVVALTVAFVGRPLCAWVLRLWNSRLSSTQRFWLGVRPEIPLGAALTGALFGGYSHVLLDSVMHSDMRPLAPFLDDNALLYVISIEHLHYLCAVLGAVGAAVLLFQLLKRKLPAARANQRA